MNLNYLKYNLLKPVKSWRNKYLKYVTAQDALRSNLYQRVAEEIAEYTGEPAETVKQKYSQGPQSEEKFRIFKEQKAVSKEEVEEFYKAATFYIYELPLWNAQRNRPRYLSMIILPYLRRFGYKKVLDFGAGAGDLCIELAQKGIEVAYCDIGEELFNFAKWRFNQRGLKIKMFKELGASDKDYDCILSFDAFEHIKDFPQTIEKIKYRLKKEGSIIFSGAFSGGTLHLEENQVYNEFKQIDKLMRDSNFYFIDKFAQYYFYKNDI